MDWIEFAAAVVVALITFAGGYIMARRKRKDELQDRSADIDGILKKLDTDKARLDNHDKQLAAIQAEQITATAALNDLRDGQVATVRAIMALLGTASGKETLEAREELNDYLTGRIGKKL